MSEKTLKQVNSKLKQLPESLLEEVERYIDILIFRNNQEMDVELSEEQKKILDNQDHLPLSEYQDNADFLSELKKDYGL